MVKRLPTMRETQVLSLGWEDPLEKEMATHSSTLAWKILRTQSTGPQRVGHDFTLLVCEMNAIVWYLNILCVAFL